MPTVHYIDDLSVASVIPPSPTGRPILLVHGILGGAWYFERYQHFFADRGYPTYAINLRGRAGSRAVRDVGAITMDEFIRDALDVARTLDRPIIIGHSMGGLIAQRLAEEGVSDIVVLLSSAPPRGIPVATPRLMLKQIKHLGALLRSRPLRSSRADADDLIFNRMPDGERQALYESLIPDSGRAARDISLGAVRVDASRVRCHMLVAGGMADRFIAPAVLRKIARKYGAPCWQYPENGHFLPMEPGWDRIADDVESWIRRRARPGSTREPRGR
jgi:pimeloyl-ACP methyl ester carboxylesterase